MIRCTELKRIYSGGSFSVEKNPQASPDLIKYIQKRVEEEFSDEETKRWFGVMFLIKENREGVVLTHSVAVYAHVPRMYGYGLGKKLMEFSLAEQNYLRPL